MYAISNDCDPWACGGCEQYGVVLRESPIYGVDLTHDWIYCSLQITSASLAKLNVGKIVH